MASSIHVIYLITKLELGGAQKVCLTLFDGLSKQTFSSHLISGPEGLLVAQVLEKKSVYLLKNLQREVGVGNVLKEIRAFYSIWRLLRQFKKNSSEPVVVHTHSTKAGLIGRWAAFLAGIGVRVHTVHGFSFHAHQSTIVWGVHVMLEWLSSLITTHYICVSEHDRQLGIRLFPRFAEKNSLIRASVEHRLFLPPQSISDEHEHQEFIFGTVSCFKPQKNLIDLLKAFRMLHGCLDEKHKSRAFLHIVGDGVMRPVLETFVRQHNLEKQIVFLGWQEAVFEHMKKWHVFVMSSLWEGLPCAVIEARLCRLPVIAYDVGGISEVIRDGENGFLIAPGQWEFLAQKMYQSLVDTSLYCSLRQYPDLLTDFDNSVMIQKHEGLYQSLISKRDAFFLTK